MADPIEVLRRQLAMPAVAELLLRRLEEFERNGDACNPVEAADERARLGSLNAVGDRLVFRESERLNGPDCEPLIYEDGWPEWQLESELE